MYSRARELEPTVSKLPGIARVERVADEGAVLAKRRPDGSLLQAPWEAFPEGPSSMRWRMGPGEDFMGSWRSYWNGLDPDDRAFYLKALRAEFSQHAYLRTELLATGDAILVEHTTNDSYWADGDDGSGRNRLGELLMQVRGELAAGGRV